MVVKIVVMMCVVQCLCQCYVYFCCGVEYVVQLCYYYYVDDGGYFVFFFVYLLCLGIVQFDFVGCVGLVFEFVFQVYQMECVVVVVGQVLWYQEIGQFVWCLCQYQEVIGYWCGKELFMFDQGIVVVGLWFGVGGIVVYI